MNKKLPGVYANKINKKLNNNKTVFYGGKEEMIKKEQKETNVSFDNNLSIKEKITEIFNSDHYIYKINVDITLKGEKITRKLIGYNDKDVITIDNELIPVKEIKDIEIKL